MFGKSLPASELSAAGSLPGTNSAGTGAIEVFFDGRDPVVGGDVMELPRRERRILEYLVKNKGRRVTKTQIFNAVYGVMNDGVDECVVESHISKLRKKLRKSLATMQSSRRATSATC